MVSPGGTDGSVSTLDGGGGNQDTTNTNTLNTLGQEVNGNTNDTVNGNTNDTVSGSMQRLREDDMETAVTVARDARGGPSEAHTSSNDNLSVKFTIPILNREVELHRTSAVLL